MGNGVLWECLSDKSITKVLSVGRRPLGISHPKLEEYIVPNFLTLKDSDEKLQGYDACLYCAGISSVGMGEAEYTRITYDTTLRFAHALLPAPRMTFIYVSGAGTSSAETGMMWARVKGKTENDLMKLPFGRSYMFRPGLMKARAEQTTIPKMQKVLKCLYPVLKVLMPGTASTMEQVGKAMIEAASKGSDKRVMEVRDINALAERRQG